MIPAGPDLWTLTPEDRAKYDVQFAELMPAAGFLSGEQAKNFFLKSNLPPAVLGQIWSLADLTADGRMDRKEFAIAMLLIKRKLQGYELPRALPRSMLAEHGGGGGLGLGGLGMGGLTASGAPSVTLPGAVPVMVVGPMAVGRSGVPVVQAPVTAPLAAAVGYGAAGSIQPMPGLVHASPARVRAESMGSDWAVPPAKKLTYMQVFNREDRMRSGYLSGYEGGRVLAETGLPKPILAKIWELSDIDGDGRLMAEEFCVAMHLAESTIAGAPLPVVLPPDLVPPQFRRRLAGDVSSGSGEGVAVPAEDLSQTLSGEDRRRENFARGNQELERRRQELQAQQRREEEERLAKERAEAEKREQARLEQERKKQQELERQLERQRQQEAEREERRRQAMEAREAARREVERQRQRDWERQRKEQVIAERKRHQEAAESLRAAVSDLKFELETLESKKGELVQRISEAKQAVLNSSLSIEAMRNDRDGKLADIDAASRLQVESEEKLRQLCGEYDRFNVTLQNQIDSRPLSDALRGLQMTHSSKKALVDGLRSRVDAAVEESRAHSLAMDLQSTELIDLKAAVGRLTASLDGRRSEVQRAREAWRLEKQRRHREETDRRAAREEEERRRAAATAAAAAELARQEAAAAAAAEKARQEAAAAAEKARLEAAAADRARQEAAERRARDEEALKKKQQLQPQPSAGDDRRRSEAADKERLAAPVPAGKASSAAAVVWPPTGKTQPTAGRSEAAANGWDAFGSPAVDLSATSGSAASADAFGALAWPALQPAIQAGTQSSAADAKAAARPHTVQQGGASTRGHPAPPQASASPASTASAVRFRALYDFSARNADELSLVANDVITVRAEDQVGGEEGWTFGSRGADKGWFPSSYVEPSDPAGGAAPAVAVAAASKALPASNDFTTASPGIMNGSLPQGEGQPPSGSHEQPKAVKRTTVPPAAVDEVAVVKMMAKFGWTAKKDNHLSFSKGDIIVVKEQQGALWLGELRGAEGWFPKDYVMPVPASPAAVTPRSSQDRDHAPKAVQPPQLQQLQQPQLQQPQLQQPQLQQPTQQRLQSDVSAKDGAECAVAIYAYSSEEPGDLTFHAGDVITVTSKEGEWWTGTVDGRSGIFPANYVKNVEGKSGIVPRPTPPAAPGQAPKEIGTVIAAYEATGPEQLSLQPNQLIQIRKKSDSGWWEGELQVRGQKKKIGWFPKDYVKVLSSGKSTPEPLRESNESPTAAVTAATAGAALQQQQPPLHAGSGGTSPQVPDGGGAAVLATHAGQEPERVVALYPYVASQEDELSFERDAIITVLDREEVEWWRGVCEGRTGMFPANYVQPYIIKAPSPTVVDIFPMTDMEKQRQFLIKELMQTEEAYVTDMIAVAEVFCGPLLESKVLSKADLDAIFVNWRELIQSNRKLVKAMKVRSRTVGAGNPIKVIGDILAESLPTMTAYIRYCSQQLNAAAVLQKRCETDAAVKEFLAKCAQSPKIRGMPLSSYLLKPMQRITRYPLLIEKIKSCTPVDHADHTNINEAHQKAEELANQVNEGVRQKDNSDKLEWIQNHVLCEGLSEKLTFNSLTNCLGQRKFIHSGALQKVRSGKDLYVFLFNDFVLLTQAVGSGSGFKPFGLDAVGVTHKMYRTPIFLNELAVKPLPAPDKSEAEACSFQMSVQGDRGMELKASSTTERDTWVKRLQQHSEAYLVTEKKGRERTHSLIQQQLSRGIGRILVIVMEGCDLMAKDDSGKSDPYCEVSIGGTTQKTKVIPGCLNPKWNSSMQFPIKSVSDDVLCLTVYDEDRYLPNDFLGRTEMRVADIMRDSKDRRGPLVKRLPLQEVTRGEIVVKFDIQLYGERQSVAS